jgi:acetylornithine deacetylase/succinyl-diaminopimelate desuccinylase-like protein
VVLIEASEESGSPHLPPYIDLLAGRIGVPDLIVCLDSGAGNYEQFWMTTSLRGVVNQVFHVHVLEQAMHSGSASGVVPSSFRIARQLLSRLEDEMTGRVLLPELQVQVPPHRIEEARLCASVLGDTLYTEFPFVAGMKPAASDLTELLLNKCVTPTPHVSVVPRGADAQQDLAPAAVHHRCGRPPADGRRRQRAAHRHGAQDLDAHPAHG